MQFKPLRQISIIVFNWMIFQSTFVYAGEFNYKVVNQFRFDDRSNKADRTQYRVRAYGQYKFDDSNWSINGFAATGKSFASSYNTLDDGRSDNFYLRRLYARYQTGEYGTKTEIGVIPTYKGRVSSTGLAKDGWIKGIRQVYGYSDDIKFEMVIGELSDIRANHVFSAIHQLNYIELEMSANINAHSSYELSLERLTEQNFIRTEYRWSNSKKTTYAFEITSLTTELKVKTVLGIESQFFIFNQPIDYFAYYSYVSEALEARAELTEDFITTGHGISVELDTPLFVRSASQDHSGKSNRWKAFSRFDAFEQNTRFILGVAYTL